MLGQTFSSRGQTRILHYLSDAPGSGFCSKSKDKKFLVLFADYPREYRAKLQQLMSSEVSHPIAVMLRFVIDLAEENDWALLQLEFKIVYPASSRNEGTVPELLHATDL